MGSSLNDLAEVLARTLEADASLRKQAEEALNKMKTVPGYSLLLIDLVQNSPKQPFISLAASIALKNFIRANWSKEKCEIEVSDEERKQIREKIASLMYQLDGSTKMQFLQAVCEIGRIDFPKNWPELISTFYEVITKTDGSRVETTLFVMDELFKHYRHEQKSRELWTAIVQVLTNFGQPLTVLFALLMEKKITANTPEFVEWLRIMHLFVEIYLSLCSQDLPEIFEDSLDSWMGGFRILLNIDSNTIPSSTTEASALEKMKSCICDIITLFSQKYDDVMKPYIEGFVEDVWSLLVNLNQGIRFDNLFHSAVGLISAICVRPSYSDTFKADGVLEAICEKIVLKNLFLRECDLEQFEDEPTDYIKRDVEGFEMGTRRRTACDLIRALCRNFEDRVIQILRVSVTSLMNDYNTDPLREWMKKDVVYNLISSVAIKTESARLGAVTINDFINLLDFFVNHVSFELEKMDCDSLVILKCDSLKYVVTFRHHLSPECIATAVSAILRFLSSKFLALHLYAAYAFDKLMLMERGAKPENVPIRELISAFFNTFDRFPYAQNSQFIMKAIMRCLTFINDETAKQSGEIISKITTLVPQALDSNVDPIHLHYVFESLCILIRRAYFFVEGGIDRLMIPLIRRIQENLVPYALQVTAVLLDQANAKRLKFGSSDLEVYSPVLTYILTEDIWQMSNVPAALLVLEAFLRSQCDILVNHSEALLNIYKRLLDSKALDQYGFQLANALLRHINGVITEEMILKPIFLRLHYKKTGKFVKEFILFVAQYSVIRGGLFFFQAVESIQKNLFIIIVEKILIDGIASLCSGVTFEQQRLCCVGYANLLAETVTQLPEQLYANLVERVSELTENAVIITSSRLDMNQENLDDPMHVDSRDPFCRLAYAHQKENIIADINNFKEHLAQAILVRGENAKPGSCATISEKSRNLFVSYISNK